MEADAWRQPGIIIPNYLFMRYPVPASCECTAPSKLIEYLMVLAYLYGMQQLCMHKNKLHSRLLVAWQSWQRKRK